MSVITIFKCICICHGFSCYSNLNQSWIWGLKTFPHIFLLLKPFDSWFEFENKGFVTGFPAIQTHYTSEGGFAHLQIVCSGLEIFVTDFPASNILFFYSIQPTFLIFSIWVMKSTSEGGFAPLQIVCSSFLNLSQIFLLIWPTSTFTTSSFPLVLQYMLGGRFAPPLMIVNFSCFHPLGKY